LNAKAAKQSFSHERDNVVVAVSTLFALHGSKRLNSSAALVPPKPKEFDSA
jgi:hypothetical protein